MNIVILGDSNTEAYKAASELVVKMGHNIIYAYDENADIAIAPLLNTILSPGDIYAPRLGTLIFHPSPLPYGRGRNAIKMAYRRREPVTAATWFWGNAGIDKGDICEQEIVRVDLTIRPREFYERDVLPAMLRTLERALAGIDKGVIRRVPQVEEFATYD